jgi:hypothetical protein
MFFELSAAAGLIAVTITIQAIFMSSGLGAIKNSCNNQLFAHGPTIVAVVGSVLIIPVILDIILWAVFYWFIGAPSFGELSISSATFTTTGYGDVVLSEVGVIFSLRSVNRTIIFGWTTALIMAAIHRLYLRTSGGRQFRDRKAPT